jgi:predicted RNA binding protein with dsRBD fold (UPF0201 family)
MIVNEERYSSFPPRLEGIQRLLASKKKEHSLRLAKKKMIALYPKYQGSTRESPYTLMMYKEETKLSLSTLQKFIREQRLIKDALDKFALLHHIST